MTAVLLWELYFYNNFTSSNFFINSSLIAVSSILLFIIFNRNRNEFSRTLKKMIDSRERFSSVKKRYEKLLNSINDLVLIISSEGMIMYANDCSVPYTGKTAEDLIGIHFTELLYDDEKNPVIASINSAETSGFFVINNDFANTQFRMIGKDGIPVWVDSKCETFTDDEGQAIGIDVVIRDIKLIKEKEEQLMVDKAVAEKANEAKSIFLANMSHELRTPLSSILGYSQLLEMRNLGELNDNQKRYIQYIKSGGEHLLEMVNDILDLSKIEAGKIKIDKKPFNVNQMLMRSPTTIKAISDQKKVNLKLDISEDLGMLNADEIRIKQVVYNLLSNAIKFTDSGCDVGICAYAENQNIIISIWDSGCGIPEDSLEKIFKPFEQVNNEISKKQGTGLGLSISKQLVELHGGSLSVKSEIGKGSVFTMVLPGRVANVKLLKDKDDLFSNTGVNEIKLSGRVALIEDDKQVAELICYFLKDAGGDVVHFTTGEDALNYLQNDINFDLFLIDIGLPGINGLRTLSHINKEITTEIPAIALTGYAMKGDREKFINNGFSDYISKPFEFEDLISKVHETIKNKRNNAYEKQEYTCS
ncbi:MAG: response regulator [Spirochaetes bacterium]|nr:response regulator [Spirochaetota bacterium]